MSAAPPPPPPQRHKPAATTWGDTAGRQNHLVCCADASRAPRAGRAGGGEEGLNHTRSRLAELSGGGGKSGRGGGAVFSAAGGSLAGLPGQQEHARNKKTFFVFRGWAAACCSRQQTLALFSRSGCATGSFSHHSDYDSIGRAQRARCLHPGGETIHLSATLSAPETCTCGF